MPARECTTPVLTMGNKEAGNYILAEKDKVVSFPKSIRIRHFHYLQLKEVELISMNDIILPSGEGPSKQEVRLQHWMQ